MKILHCADLHLDSALNTHLSSGQAGIRRNELLLRFVSMVEYAAEHEVRLVLIAGDLFDSPQISQKTGHVIVETIRRYPHMDFLYLKGNHDESALPYGEDKPENLKLFQGVGGSYRYGKVVVTGLNQNDYAAKLKLNPEDTNLVMMHGQVLESGKTGTDGHMIRLADLSNHNIDYLALGHIHSFRKEKLGKRGIYCYSGCLEPRGFDETGDKGFVIVTIDPEEAVGYKAEAEFIPYATRHAYVVEVDISKAENMPQICECMDQALEFAKSEDMVKVILTGERKMEVQVPLQYLEQKYAPHYFALRMEDATDTVMDYETIEKEDSLKGTFLRLVMQDQTIEDKQREEIMRLGIRALSGEEL